MVMRTNASGPPDAAAPEREVFMRLFARKGSAWGLIAVPALIVGGMSTAIAAPSGPSGTASHHQTVYMPKKTSNMDCNGWSKKYKALDPGHRMLCVDPIQVKKLKYGGRTVERGYQLLDNGHYVGHDEPSVKFISNGKNTGNTMTYFMKLPTNPAAPPTSTGTVTTYGELSPAPWFGLALCDSGSYPQNKCIPDSNKNSGSIDDPFAAGSAFMELQFYPPGFTPFQDNISCSRTKWCGAMTIDSLMCTFNFVVCNPNCEEPVNFAFLQTNGVPTGPPSPQLADAATNLPNKHTLEMNQGDELEVQISDPRTGPNAGFTAKVTDLSTGKVGFMVASAKNGFMATNLATCGGTKHTFHAEYNTAAQQNQTPWAALEGGVLMEQEIGHFEVCKSVSNQLGFTAPPGSSKPFFIDAKVYETCNGAPGGAEGGSGVGEGPCSFTTFICANAQTQGTTGPIACPDPHFTSRTHCEFADANCFNKGTRTVIINNKPTTQFQEVTGCEDNAFQNGDLDYDGNSYVPDWPNGSPNFPTSIFYLGPFNAAGNPYPKVQFETDAAGSEFQCNTLSGAGCTVPPYPTAHYPYWSMTVPLPIPSTSLHACFWNFGEFAVGGVTQTNFGGDAQYGTPNIARFGGTIISAPQRNPEFGGKCPAAPKL
jgi:hypothetical protein